MTDDLAALNNALAIATADRMQAESLLGRRPDASNGALENVAISQLREQRAQAQSEYAKLMEQFEPAIPQRKRCKRRSARSIQRFAERKAASVRRCGRITTQPFLASVCWKGQVNALKGNLTDLRRRSIQYNIYQRDADTNRELYNALLQRYKEIGVAGGVEKNNVSIADAPKLPDRPSSPNLLLNVLLATFAGGFAAAGLAAGLDQIDEEIADPSETEAKLGHPLLGTIPKVRDETPLEAFENPRSPLVEAYLAIQATLELSTARGTPKSIAVTSTRAREGNRSRFWRLPARWPARIERSCWSTPICVRRRCIACWAWKIVGLA